MDSKSSHTLADEIRGTWLWEMLQHGLKVERERTALREAIRLTITENLHLADGDDCTLKRLKDAIKTPPETHRSVYLPVGDGEETKGRIIMEEFRDSFPI